MSHLFAYCVQGATLQLRVDAAALLPLAESLHSSCRVRIEECPPDHPADLVWSSTPEGQPVLTIDKEAESGSQVDEAILFFLSEHRLTQRFAERLGHLLQLHAAAVVDPRGRGWLICGASRAGKTSLTLGLVLEGWRWLSDELALFDRDDTGTILGFPRNFNLKETSFPIFPETAGLPHTVGFYSTGRQLRVRFFDPLDLAPGSWQAQAPLQGLVLPRWNPGLAAPQIRRTSGVAAAQVLLGETACWQPWALPVITTLCRDVPMLEFNYSHPRQLAPLMQAMSEVSG